MRTIRFAEFQALDLRIGRIIDASRVEGSHNLMRLQVDFGGDTRQAVAGLIEHYHPDELVGNTYLFLYNLEPKTMMGVKSECMILAADDRGGKVVLMRPERDVAVGSIVR